MTERFPLSVSRPEHTFSKEHPRLATALAVLLALVGAPSIAFKLPGEPERKVAELLGAGASFGEQLLAVLLVVLGVAFVCYLADSMLNLLADHHGRMDTGARVRIRVLVLVLLTVATVVVTGEFQLLDVGQLVCGGGLVLLVEYHPVQAYVLRTWAWLKETAAALVDLLLIHCTSMQAQWGTQSPTGSGTLTSLNPHGGAPEYPPPWVDGCRSEGGPLARAVHSLHELHPGAKRPALVAGRSRCRGVRTTAETLPSR